MKPGTPNETRNQHHEAVRQVRDGGCDLRRVEMKGGSQMIGVLNPDEMSSDEILEEVAALLAKGYRQHLQKCGEKIEPSIVAIRDYSSVTETEYESPGRQPPCCHAG